MYKKIQLKTSLLFFGFMLICLGKLSAKGFASEHSEAGIFMDSIPKPDYDSVFFDGYYITLYDKKDMLSDIKSRKNRIQGKPFSFPADYETISYFVSKQEMLAKGINKVVRDIPEANKTKLYFVCDELLSFSFSTPFKKKLTDFQCNWPAFTADYQYYTIKGRFKFCFKIHEISGWFMVLHVNTEEQKDRMGRSIALLQPDLNDFFAYYFLRYKSYSNYPVSLKEKLRLWKEVLPIF